MNEEEQNVPEDMWIKPAGGEIKVPESTEKFVPRGVGDVYVKPPIACVLEVLTRIPAGDDKTWKPVPPMTKGASTSGKVSFAIMNAACTTEVMNGSFKRPGRECHPSFAAFNTCHPEQANLVKAKIIHFREEDAWQHHLGAYMSPQKNQSPPKGWWCRGDGKVAERYINGSFQKITCPNRLCEFSQPAFGFGGKQQHCKPKITLIAQFNWSDKSPLPRMIFEWNSQSWNNMGSLEGMFKLIRETSLNMGWGEQFPMFGLPFTMQVAQTLKNGNKFPEVHFSVDGDLMHWMGLIRNAMEQGQMQLQSGPPPLRELPPPGMTRDDVDRAREATLNPEYRPANERR